MPEMLKMPPRLVLAGKVVARSNVPPRAKLIGPGVHVTGAGVGAGGGVGIGVGTGAGTGVGCTFVSGHSPPLHAVAAKAKRMDLRFI